MHTQFDFSSFLRKKAALLCVAALFLSGCGTFESTFSGNSGGSTDSKPQLVAEPDKTSLMIADAADRATKALEGLSQVEQVRTPSAAQAAPPIANAPMELQRPVTFAWSGPVEPVAADIAAWTGYAFRTVGDQPPSPIIVTLDVFNTPMVEVLRDIGLQMGTRADLKLDANRRAIEIIYASTANGTPNTAANTPRRGRR